MPYGEDKIKDDHEDVEFRHLQIQVRSANHIDSRPRSYICRRKFPWFGDIRIYVISMALLTVAYGMFWGYFPSMLPSIERRYHMPSAMSGFILSCPEIGRLSTLLFISHFGNRVNMPRAIGIGYTVVSLAVFCQTIPHYAIKPDASALSNVTDRWAADLCVNRTSINDEAEEIHGNSGSYTSSAYVIFMLTFIAMGGAAAPFYSLGFTYIENNCDPSKTSRYIGLVDSGFAFGPMLGLFMGAWCTTMYVESGDTDLTPGDPVWVGRWWLGLLIVASAELLCCLVLYCFPKEIGSTSADDDHSTAHRDPLMVNASPPISPLSETDDVTVPLAITKDKSSAVTKVTETEIYGVKGLFWALLRLFKNPVYMSLVASYCIANMFIGGFLAFFPKYTEIQLSLPSPTAIRLAAIINGIGFGISMILSGNIITWCKLKVGGIYLLVLGATFLICIFCVVTMFLGCDAVSVIGVPDIGGGELNMTHPCNAECGCEISIYSPVCDDGRTYFSPCHAGCVANNITHDIQNGVYFGCSCTESGTATPGKCQNECNITPAFGIFIIFVFLMMGTIYPNVSLLTMRVVDSSDKALALGVATMATSLLGWMPGPPIYGAVIDTSCRVWEVTGSGQTGSCWIYDAPAIRLKIMGMSTGIFTCSLLFLTLSYLLFRKRERSQKK